MAEILIHVGCKLQVFVKCNFFDSLCRAGSLSDWDHLSYQKLWLLKDWA